MAVARSIQALIWRELQVLAMRFTEGLPEGDPALVTIDGTTTNTERPRTED